MPKVKAVLLDFDGTLSTLRAGWEKVMKPFMMEEIRGGRQLTEQEEAELEREVDEYIDRSTGVQTIFQMSWLEDTVRGKGWNRIVRDAWEYKAEYNRRLLEQVHLKTTLLAQGSADPETYLIRGAARFVRELHRRGVELYLASGTDHADVVREAEALGLAPYFRTIAGAPAGRADCSKEKVLKELLTAGGFQGRELAVIGDGKVEIRLGKEAGALALGLASDEERRKGINPAKVRRLTEAGADWIAGDFGELDAWLARLGLAEPQAERRPILREAEEGGAGG